MVGGGGGLEEEGGWRRRVGGSKACRSAGRYGLFLSALSVSLSQRGHTQPVGGLSPRNATQGSQNGTPDGGSHSVSSWGGRRMEAALEVRSRQLSHAIER